MGWRELYGLVGGDLRRLPHGRHANAEEPYGPSYLYSYRGIHTSYNTK